MTKKEHKGTNTSNQEVRGIRPAIVAYAFLVALQLFVFHFTNVFVFYAQALDVLAKLPGNKLFSPTLIILATLPAYPIHKGKRVKLPELSSLLGPQEESVIEGMMHHCDL